MGNVSSSPSVTSNVAYDVNSVLDAFASNGSGSNPRLDINNLDVALKEQLKRVEYNSATHIQWSNRGLSSNEVIALAITMHKNTSVVGIDISGNEVSEEALALISKLLKATKTLRELNMSRMNLGENIGLIAAGMSVNNTVQTLSIYENDLGDVGAVSIGSMLRRNNTLQKLMIGNNEFKPKGLRSFCRGVSETTSLKELYAYGVNLCDEGGILLAEALKKNTTLEKLNITGNKLGTSAGIAIASALAHCNTTLKELNIETNEIGDIGGEAFGQMLRHNTTLQKLRMFDNQLGERAIKSLLKCLEENITIQELDAFGLDLKGYKKDERKMMEDFTRWNRELRGVALFKPSFGPSFLRSRSVHPAFVNFIRTCKNPVEQWSGLCTNLKTNILRYLVTVPTTQQPDIFLRDSQIDAANGICVLAECVFSTIARTAHEEMILSKERKKFLAKENKSRRKFLDSCTVVIGRKIAASISTDLDTIIEAERRWRRLNLDQQERIIRCLYHTTSPDFFQTAKNDGKAAGRADPGYRADHLLLHPAYIATNYLDLTFENPLIFYSFFNSLIGKEVIVELKNDLAIKGTLHSVDQFLNIKLKNISVVDEEKHPHLVSVQTCFIRGSVVRYVQINRQDIDIELLQDAARVDAREQKKA